MHLGTFELNVAVASILAVVGAMLVRMQRVRATRERTRERDRLQAALQECEQRLSYLIRATRSAQWDWDMASQQIRHDQRWLELLGLPDGGLQHPSVQYFELIEPRDVPLLKKSIEMAERGNGEYSLEYRLRRPDGRLIWVLDQGLVVARNPQGQASRMVGAISDITERKNQDKELAQHRHHLETLVAKRTAELEEAKRSAEAANRAKSDFLANMSHEIRTPMNAVLGIAYLLGKSNLPPQTQYLIRKIVSAGRSLQMIINDILDYSKIESGHLEVELAAFDLGHVLHRLSMMLSTSAEEKGLALIIDPPPRGAVNLMGDALKLEQLLVNLTGNAVKFTEQGCVQVKTTVQAQTEHSTTLKFSIVDTGIGIAPDKQAQLFQPFTQADASTTRRFGGTGLGLAISRKLVEKLDGDIGLTSTPGVGSEFWFTLTFMRDAAAASLATSLSETAQTQAAPQAERLQRIRMLVVDDSAINREISERIFESEGARVFLANDGQQAVEWLRQHVGAVDIVLMDVQMPVMDGYEATRIIRTLPEWRDVPILALSAGVFKSMQEAALAAGMNDFIGKPYDVDAVIARVRALTGHDEATALPDTAPLDLPATLPMAGFGVEPTTAPDTSQDLPGLKVGDGLAKWKNQLVYVRALRHFALEYADSVQAMRDDASPNSVARLAHKIVGVAGNLSMPAIVTTAAALQQACLRDADVSQPLAAYAQALDTALTSIGLYTASVNPADSPVQAVAAPIRSTDPMAALLADVVLSFDSDDPSKVEPLLVNLATQLSSQQMAPLWSAVENFNFRGGKDATLALATELKKQQEVSR